MKTEVRAIPKGLKFDTDTIKSSYFTWSIESKEIIESILEIEKKENIDEIYLYGSWISPKKEIKVKNGWFSNKVYEEMIEPNDIDILIVTKNNYEIPIEYNGEGLYDYFLEDGYYRWNKRKKKNDLIHLFLINKNSLMLALDSNDNNLMKRIFDNKHVLLWKNNV